MTYSSPLEDEHLKLGAKVTDFGGWSMPLAYPKGTIAEHRAVRSAVGLFDVTHLGKITVEGPGAEAALDRALPGRIAKLRPGRAAYNLVLNEAGGVVDDIFVYRTKDGFLVVPNASNMDEVLGFLESRAAEGVSVRDDRLRWAILAVTGPKARELVTSLVPGSGDLKMHDFAQMELDGLKIMVARTGYTGEVTFELLPEWDEAPAIWRRLLEAGQPAGITPAGLGARDTLRLEMGYPLHGHELSPQINPLEAGLGWVIDWDKEFAGKEALIEVRKRGLNRKLVGLVGSEGRIPRAGHPVVRGSEQIGEVTSGNFSPTLGVPIALAFVGLEHSEPGTSLAIEIRGKRLPVTVVAPPFIKN